MFVYKNPSGLSLEYINIGTSNSDCVTEVRAYSLSCKLVRIRKIKTLVCKDFHRDHMPIFASSHVPTLSIGYCC